MNAGTAVLVIRENDKFSELLRSMGLEITNLPLIKTEPLPDQCNLRAVIKQLDQYDCLFFTSPAAAEIFVKEMGSQPTYDGKLYVMGKRSKEVFDRAGLRSEFDPAINSADELIHAHGEGFTGKRALFFRGNRSMLTIPNLLKGKASVDEVVVYRTVGTDPADTHVIAIMDRLTGGEFAWTCFFSPSAVEIFKELFGNGVRTKIAAIGQTTAQRAEETGFNVEFVSPRSAAVDFARTFALHLNGK
ncbi:uroporphyrinogen-III synthase [soil metagenome]